MSITTDSIKRYNSAQYRFFKPAVVNFFAREFPKFFGPVMREKVADEIISLFDRLRPDIKCLKPGQILWNALDKNTRGNLPNQKYVPVVLTIINDEDVKQLIKGNSMATIIKNAIARIIREAYDQGGILSTRDIALLTLREPTRVSKIRITYEKEHNCTLPHTGALHDMGSCISHKTMIIRKVVVEKKDPADVARECQHSQQAVDKYLKNYQRVKTAYKYNQDINYVHAVTGISKHVIKKYVNILTNTTFFT